MLLVIVGAKPRDKADNIFLDLLDSKEALGLGIGPTLPSGEYLSVVSDCSSAPVLILTNGLNFNLAHIERGRVTSRGMSVKSCSNICPASTDD